jgi:hypothetical protein
MRITVVRQCRQSQQSFPQPRTKSSTGRRFNRSKNEASDAIVVEPTHVLKLSFQKGNYGWRTLSTDSSPTIPETSTMTMILSGTKPSTNTTIPSTRRPVWGWTHPFATFLSTGSSCYSSTWPVVSRRSRPCTECMPLLRLSFTTASIAPADAPPTSSGMQKEESNHSNPQSAVVAAAASEMFPKSSSVFKNPSSNNKLNLLVHVNMEELRELACKRCTPLSLKDMYKYAVKDANNPEQRMWNAQFLHKE